MFKLPRMRILGGTLTLGDDPVNTLLSCEICSDAPAASMPWQNHVLDEIDYGIVVLTPELTIAYCNKVARAEFDEPSPIVLVGGALRATTPRDDTLLQDALRAAAQRGLRRLHAFHCGEQTLTMAIVPMELGVGASCASVLVMLGRRRVCEALSAQGLARCLGLTPAEAQVLAQLSAQQRPIDIARGLCVALCTVRSHIASIRSKTGSSSIRELIQLMARLPPLTSRLLQ
jgi:DNA-binding CsgD family transcriptional regulator